MVRTSGTPVRNDPDQYVGLAGEWWRPDGALAALHWLADARARLVPPAGRAGALLVDLGCGGGLMAPRLRGRGYRHLGVDLVPTSLRVAAGHGVAPVCGDVHRVPLRAGCADVVLVGELLEHVVEPAGVIAEAARLLRPGGLLVGDTIAATAVARFVSVSLAERVPGIAPRYIHDPRLFVDPDTVLAAFARCRLRGQVRGIRPKAAPFARFLLRRRGPVRMVPVGTTAGLFQFRAVRPPDGTRPDGDDRRRAGRRRGERRGPA